MVSKHQRVSKPRNAILVLGMHRSGTSAMTRVLNLLGAELGRELLPSKEDNAAGFWENQAVVQANEYLLRALGLTWHDPVSLPPRWKQQAMIRRFGDIIKQLLDDQFNEAPLIALKDPRLSRFAPVWVEAIAAEGIIPKIVVVIRHPSEVTRSLKRRDGFSVPKSQLLWLLHTVESMATAEGFCHVYVHYDRLIADWRTEVMRVAGALDIAWPHDVEDVASQIDAFIDPALRHHSVVANAPGNAPHSFSPVISGKIAQIYNVCTAMAEDDPLAKADVRNLLRDVRPWIEVFGGPAREIAVQIHQLADQFHSQSAAHLAAEADSKVEISSLRASVSALELEREAARANIGNLAAQILVAKEAHDARDHVEADLQASLKSLRGELASGHARAAGFVDEIRAAKVTIDGLVNEIGVARKSCEDLEAQIARARAAHDERDQVERELREALQQKDAEIAAAGSNIDKLVEEANAARANIEDLQAQINRARAAHDEHDQVEQELREALQQKDAEIAAAGNNIDKLVEEVNAARDNIEDLQAQIFRARAAHDERDQVEQGLHEALQQKDAEIAAAGSNIDKLIEEVNAARDNIENLQAQIIRARAAHDERDQVEQGLREALQQKDAEIAAARGNIENLVAELSRARVSHAELSEQIDRARAAHVIHCGIEADLRSQLSRLSHMLSQEQDASATLVAEIDVARNTIQAQITELQSAADANRIQIAREAELHSSLSQRDVEIARISDAFAHVEAKLVEAVQQGERHEAALKRIESARWSRFGRVLGLLRGD